MRLKHLLIAGLAIFSLSGCSILEKMVYKIDIPQGNYVEDRQVDKLRVDMTKEQVTFVLGSPMLVDSFDHDVWNYLYHFTSGRGEVTTKQLVLTFAGDNLKTVVGDYPLNPNFATPLDR
ncbi:outer membrane protein assembly factor BamE [Moritella sp.]|uniref:outer membrane protein assembly factor BamE n=1 Tax=Moritella sp. TaxID=78556 RepID=UPI001D75A325|nr:outer membrane protein assembly factor BamE [Moritella sp.]MCJ8348067.1 outer membrane protein assembly factor BamE [Moritella sp.]NQZ42225.1 outer membrane protein assembly factor BamE [Moritella sp.]